MYKCKQCGRKFNQPIRLALHVKHFHPKAAGEPVVESKPKRGRPRTKVGKPVLILEPHPGKPGYSIMKKGRKVWEVAVDVRPESIREEAIRRTIDEAKAYAEDVYQRAVPTIGYETANAVRKIRALAEECGGMKQLQELVTAIAL